MKRRNLLGLIGISAVGAGTAVWWKRNEINRTVTIDPLRLV